MDTDAGGNLLPLNHPRGWRGHQHYTLSRLVCLVGLPTTAVGHLMNTKRGMLVNQPSRGVLAHHTRLALLHCYELRGVDSSKAGPCRRLQVPDQA
jgi:hypothetical protein